MIEHYSGNEMRAYPVYEGATQMAADGTGLPQDMIVDLALTVPRALLSSLYISALTVTPGIVSLAIASSSGGVFAGTFAQPVSPYRPYALTPIIGMASGHVVFGKGVTRTAAELRFLSTSLVTSGVDIRTVHPIESDVVLSIGRHLSLEQLKLKGIVKLETRDNVTIRYDGGKLLLGLTELNRYSFVGPCDRQAIFENCGGPPIRTINGVGPDENGAITIEVDNA